MKPREKPEYCDFCDAETDALKWYETGLDAEGAWLCTICAATPCGNVALHPNAYRDADSAVLKTIAITTRMILEAVEKSGRAT